MKNILALALLTSSLWATSVTFKGEEVTLNSNGLKLGMQAPVFKAVDKDFMEVTVGGKSDKVQVIAFIPSFDSDVCKRETIVFNQKVSKMKNVNLMVISKDLPFALGRFFHDNKIKNVMTLSDYKDANNVLRYGATISSPIFLEGFFGRVVYVVDTNGKVTYKEVVPELSDEPNYENIINAVDSLTH
jgi:thiol peroxidase